MKKALGFAIPAIALLVTALVWIQPAPSQSDGALRPSLFSFQITFGEKQERSADYSGSLSLSDGKLLRLTPWRFFGGDALQGTNGWKLAIKRTGMETQPDQPRPLATPGQIPTLVSAGIVATLDAPASTVVSVSTAQGNFKFPLRDLRQGAALSFLDDVTVRQVPSVQTLSASSSGAASEENDYPSLAVTRNGTAWVAWQSYKDRGENVYARHSTSSGWSNTFPITERKGDIFQTAIAEDAQGRIWVIWSERNDRDWDLYARSFNGSKWDAQRKLTSGQSPNIFHRLVADRSSALHLIWIAHENGQSHVLWSKLQANDWSKPVSIGGPNAWMPEAAADSKGNLYVAWDSYKAGNYDIYFRKIGVDGALGAVQQVTQSPRFQAHATVAVDKQDRLWIAWDESGSNWGKDWSHEDQWRSTVLYSDRHIRVAVLDNGTWKQPAGDFTAAAPVRYNRYVQNPRLASDAAGRIWIAFQIRTSTVTNRGDYWANNGRWEHFLSSYDGDRWTSAVPIPSTSSRPDGTFQIKAGAQGIWSAWVNDNRRFGAAGAQRKTYLEVDAAPFDSQVAVRNPVLEEFAETPGAAALVHRDEAGDVMRIRNYRSSFGGAELRIVRGDFHRHTEISGDGAGDGSVEDYFRYMMDAAQMDTGIISDHNAGADDEYTWWRTEKSIDLFHIRSGFTPLFGYERSVPYPNGHRNVVFAQRGVRTLPIGREEMQGTVNSGPILYPYLKQNRGICMLHSLATGQGSDYRDNDPEIEPLVEIYQGYHANYEYEGAPRAETDDFQVNIHGGYKPLGFYWTALAKGLKLGTQSSSDHISTHTSYTMIYSPSVERSDIVESMRKRHAYGATDNIVLDYKAVDASGGVHMMGDAFEASAAPKLSVKVTGTGRIALVEIVKNGKFVFDTKPSENTADFTYLDNNTSKGESYYYVRVTQADRNLAWSSPIWVKYR